LAVKKQFLLGILMGMGLMACTGATFPYKYYGVDLKDEKLLGPTPADDLSLLECLPTATDASPCTAMMTSVAMAMKQDYIQTKNDLIACQQALVSK
jgi:hypothetical protein